MITIKTLEYRSYAIIRYTGNNQLLDDSKMGLFCSVKAPGDIILKTFEYAKNLREENITVIGGFHSPMEQESLRILLKGTQPIIICPARNIETMRIPSEWKKHIENGRMLILSPFMEHQKRTSAQTAQLRNQFVADIADQIFIAYAAPNSKTEMLCKNLIAKGKEILTIGSDDNKSLIEMGAKCIDVLETNRMDRNA